VERANRQTKEAEDEMKIVQRQMERMREALPHDTSASTLGAILEENQALKDSVKQLQSRVRAD
jgi:hypothetical protein